APIVPVSPRPVFRPAAPSAPWPSARNRRWQRTACRRRGSRNPRSRRTPRHSRARSRRRRAVPPALLLPAWRRARGWRGRDGSWSFEHRPALRRQVGEPELGPRRRWWRIGIRRLERLGYPPDRLGAAVTRWQGIGGDAAGLAGGAGHADVEMRLMSPPRPDLRE